MKYLMYPHFIVKPLCIAITLISVAVMAETPTVSEIVVTSDFREADLSTIGSSISVLSADVIDRREALHLERVLNVVPNVNFSTGASRGRFVQIRGIGERSQFKDPLDSSVGLVVDGADLSGLGLAGGLMDTRQVEVLRGPQGTRFGASALAGAINIKSNRPTEEFEGSVAVGLGNYGKQDAGLVVSGPLKDNKLLGRAAYQSSESNGYIKNHFLNKGDTNNIDEEMVRLSLRWLASDDLSIDFSALYVDADNGYNAFSYFNSRNIPTDDPGHDRQQTTSFTTEVFWEGASAFNINIETFIENSDLEYGFDWDWGNLIELGYRGGENNIRERESFGADLRITSRDDSTFLGAAWVAGVYLYEREVALDATNGDNFSGFGTFSSQTDTSRLAAYGEFDWELSSQISLLVGWRWENYQLDYSDNVGVKDKPDENLWGGKIGLEYQLDENALIYSSVSRGYKGGGVNGQAIGRVISDSSTPADVTDFLLARSSFDSETLLSYEMGVKSWYLERSLFLSAAIFYMDRENMQASSSVFFPPAEWRSYIDNVDGGDNYGLEIEAQWQVLNNFNLFANVGLLETKLGDLIVQDLDAGGELDQSGRDQAHAPRYQFNIGGKFTFLEKFSFMIEMDGKDKFYFSNSHNERSESYELVHASLNYLTENISLSMWGRNLTDKDYQTRGFYFANTPPNYARNESYYQLGEPRIYGVTAKYRF